MPAPSSHHLGPAPGVDCHRIADRDRPATVSRTTPVPLSRSGHGGGPRLLVLALSGLSAVACRGRSMTMRGASKAGGGVNGQAPEGTSPLRTVRGDLAELLDHRPVFRVRLHGYDRLEVDNYTAWAEGELATVRRQVDHLLSRFGE